MKALMAVLQPATMVTRRVCTRSDITLVSYHNLRRDIGATLVAQLDVVGQPLRVGLCASLLALVADTLPQLPESMSIGLDMVEAGIMPVRPLTFSLCPAQIVRLLDCARLCLIQQRSPHALLFSAVASKQRSDHTASSVVAVTVLSCMYILPAKSVG